MLYLNVECRAHFDDGIGGPLLGPVTQQYRRNVSRRLFLGLIETYMWRNTKSSVRDQLQLPAQTIEAMPLTFSQVEEAFYFKVFETVLPILQTASRGWVKEERAESKKKAEAAAAQRRKEEAKRQARRKRRAQSVSEEVILDETGEEWQSDNGGESEAGIDSKEQSAAQESTGMSYKPLTALLLPVTQQ